MDNENISFPDSWKGDGVLEHLDYFKISRPIPKGREIDHEVKVTSSDINYKEGDLSIYPQHLDTYSTLFTAIDSGITNLIAPLSFDGDIVYVKDASRFPMSGLISIDQEVIFYNKRTDRSFQELKRGASGQRTPHNPGTPVKAAVCADHHNALRDAIWKIQRHFGLENDFGDTTIYGLLNKLEQRFIPLSPVFSTIKRVAPPGTLFSFKDRSVGDPVSWQWDFGDGYTSTERNPTHRYFEGPDGKREYDVSLTCRDSMGNTATIKRLRYIRLFPDDVLIYAETTRKILDNRREANIRFVDQSLGRPGKRIWSFGDDSSYEAENQWDHSVVHTYTEPGVYEVYLSIEADAEYGHNMGVARSNREPILITIME